ncbi:MAG: prepilin-type N-terminal cleavage/methylation domain-containing protein [Gammaproteobacteria bacterium]|nr:prepilin-type N-terminal cleavage/methylation domain-containing protein [Gammaproteobacteria bacterium]
MTQRQKMLGFTLPELLVALVVNAILFTALISIFIVNITHYNTIIKVNRLNQQLQATMQLMVNDIRRAGYWANANNDIGTNQNNNPFMASGVDLTIGASNTCILFAYDKNSSGTLPSIGSSSDDERYGYRLTGNAVQSRPWGASFNCTGTDWENVTDPNLVTVTALTFTLTTQNMSAGGTSTISLRSVDITLTGQLTDDATVTKTLTEHVRIRNDKFNP